jgi:hypothetical protein
MKRKIMEHAKLIKTEVKALLPPTPATVAIGLDIWSDSTRQAFMAIKAFWVDTSELPWASREVLLSFVPFEGSHTGKRIAHLVKLVLKDYDLQDRVIAYTMDNASNNNVAFDELFNAVDGGVYEALASDGPPRRPFHCPCIMHVVNLSQGEIWKSVNARPRADDTLDLFSEAQLARDIEATRPSSNVRLEDPAWIEYTVFKVRSVYVY